MTARPTLLQEFDNVGSRAGFSDNHNSICLSPCPMRHTMDAEPVQSEPLSKNFAEKTREALSHRYILHLRRFETQIAGAL